MNYQARLERSDTEQLRNPARVQQTVSKIMNCADRELSMVNIINYY